MWWNKQKKRDENNESNKKYHSHVVLAMALIAVISIIVVVLTTFLLIQLKFKEPVKITISDWLKMIIPITGGAIITIFAFLGVDRLKNFDERQDRLEKDLRDDLNDQVNNAVEMVQPRLNKTYEEWEESLKKKLALYDESIEHISERITKYDKVIGSIEKLEEVSDAIGNIEEAHDFLVELYEEMSDVSGKAQRTRILWALVDRVKSGEIKGESADYHNFASILAKKSYYEMAADVTKKGLDIFSDDNDLLSDYTYYSHKAGRRDEALDGLSRLDKIESRELWNWRAFTFYIDVVNDGEANEENKRRALLCVDDYKRILPDDERAYMEEYETLKKYGKLQDAEAALKYAVDNLAMTAQCSLALAKIYHMRGEYDEAIRIASLAIIGQAETQPSSSTGATFAQRGFSKDARVCNLKLGKESDENRDAMILSAIKDYKMALSLGYCYPNIKVRITILKSMLTSSAQENYVYAELNERVEQMEEKMEQITGLLQAIANAG